MVVQMTMEQSENESKMLGSDRSWIVLGSWVVFFLVPSRCFDRYYEQDVLRVLRFCL
jgi:hypothetical protein